MVSRAHGKRNTQPLARKLLTELSKTETFAYKKIGVIQSFPIGFIDWLDQSEYISRVVINDNFPLQLTPKKYLTKSPEDYL